MTTFTLEHVTPELGDAYRVELWNEPADSAASLLLTVTTYSERGSRYRAGERGIDLVTLDGVEGAITMDEAHAFLRAHGESVESAVWGVL